MADGPLHYVATSLKQLSVTHAVKASFTGPADVNLVLARGNRLEVHRATADGLEPVFEAPLHGVIQHLGVLPSQVRARQHVAGSRATSRPHPAVRPPSGRGGGRMCRQGTRNGFAR
jgi:hypothetical protein